MSVCKCCKAIGGWHVFGCPVPHAPTRYESSTPKSQENTVNKLNLEEDYIRIHVSELPAFKVVDRNGKPHVDCGSDWGTWDVTHVDRMRTAALEYVGAWLTAEKWHVEQAAAARTRRDELAAEFTAVNSYSAQLPYTQKLIDRIIDLERKAS